MVLTGTVWQVPLINTIKKLGHDVFLVNPVRNSGVYEKADFFLESDIFDIDRIEKFAKSNQIEAIISDECDIAMPVVAELGDRLNVTTLSREAAALFTNKYKMREFSENIGLCTVEHRLCDSPEQVIQFMKELGKTVIIKPLDSNSSHGVFRVKTEQEAWEHFHECISFSRTERLILAERYISGTEFTVDGVKTPGGHYTLAISEKKHFRHNNNIANELFFTYSNPKYDYERLKEENDRLIMNSPLQFGLTHAEYKYEDGEFFLIEIAARGGGNRISSLIAPFMSGRDTYEYLINCSLGKGFDAEFKVRNDCLGRAVVLKFFETPSTGGRVKEICGLDELEHEPDVMEYSINCKKGDYIHAAQNDSDRVGYYIAGSENEEKLRIVMRRIEERFRIIVE